MCLERLKHWFCFNNNLAKTLAYRSDEYLHPKIKYRDELLNK